MRTVWIRTTSTAGPTNPADKIQAYSLARLARWTRVELHERELASMRASGRFEVSDHDPTQRPPGAVAGRASGARPLVIGALAVELVPDVVTTSQRPTPTAAPPVRAAAGGDGSKAFATAHGTVTLTANQIRECELAGARPEVFAESLARRLRDRGAR